MRKLLLLLLVAVVVPASALAQDDDWRNRRASRGRRDYRTEENMFELTPMVGYRWGGTIYRDQNAVFNQDVTAESSAAFGGSFGIPILDGLKLELMVNHQDTHLTTGGSTLFTPEQRVSRMGVTYYQAGLQIPFAQSRAATPYAVVSAGVANLDPNVRGASSSNRFAASGGFGVKVPISRNAGVRAEVRGYFTSLSNYDNSCSHCYYNYNHDFYQGETNFGVFFKF
jgi:hypothetical protein